MSQKNTLTKQKRNLTKQKIIEVTFELADEIGLNKVTFQKIAEKLGIKYPSLYNHFKNMDNLKLEMTISSLNRLNTILTQGLIGKSGEDAIKEFSKLYKNFAFENRTAYELFLSVPTIGNDDIYDLTRETVNIIVQILSIYTDNRTYLVHKSRALRSSLHGFISLYFFGYFQGEVDLEESFKFLVEDFIYSLPRISEK
ncbi:TetR/AcrR family transcriptional regulator [Clostridium thermobutyricum]|uniref:TetR/AcrR family transcriptional regulator n=1 Tax=Clostridium thermobutyricum TaxID=29372 RepID=UPI003F51F23C